MSEEFTQIPIDFPLQFVRGDDVVFSRVFANVDLTGFTVTATVYSGLGETTTPVVPSAAVTVTTATVSGITSSTVQVSLTEAQTLSISPTGLSRWFLRWVSPSGVTRTVLSGNVTAKNP
jgi:hypothetical protein